MCMIGSKVYGNGNNISVGTMQKLYLHSNVAAVNAEPIKLQLQVTNSLLQTLNKLEVCT